MDGHPRARSGALATLAGRRGLWLGDDLAAMALLASLAEQAERCLPQLVHDARATGHTWHEIAQAPAPALTTRASDSIAHRRWPYPP